jgi:hypothetical protein
MQGTVLFPQASDMDNASKASLVVGCASVLDEKIVGRVDLLSITIFSTDGIS